MKIFKYKDYIFEKVGVNEDTEILSDFIISHIKNFEVNKTYVFHKNLNNIKPDADTIYIENLPELSFNLNKLVMDYVDDKSIGFVAAFHPNLSSPKTGVFYFTFNKYDRKTIWKHVIYHEVNHAIQYIKRGRGRMWIDRKNTLHGSLKQIFKEYPYDIFIHLYYLSMKSEQSSFVSQLYGKFKYNKKIKNVDDLKIYFHSKKNSEFSNARSLMIVDLKKLFSTVPEKGKHNMRVFFTFFKDYKEKLSKVNNLNDLLKIDTLHIDTLISDEEINRMIERYTKYFNKSGKKFMRKLDKVYSLLYDHFNKI